MKKELNYNDVVAFGKSKGFSQKEVDKLMLYAHSKAPQFSNFTDDELAVKASDACEVVYDSQGAEAFNTCRKKYIEDYKAEELRKSKNQNFWQGVWLGLGRIADQKQGTKTGGNNQGTEGDGSGGGKEDDPKGLSTLAVVGIIAGIATVIGIGWYLVAKNKAKA